MRKFNVAYAGLYGAEAIIGEYLNATVFKIIAPLGEVYTSNMMRYPVHSSTTNPLLGPDFLYQNFEMGSIPYRAINEMQKIIVSQCFPTTAYKEILPEEAQYAADTFGRGLIMGGGIEGFVDPVPRMPNVLRMFPFTF